MGLNWSECLSGCCGWMLTRTDVKRAQGRDTDEISFHGPKGLYRIMESFGWFLKRDMLRIGVWEWCERDGNGLASVNPGDVHLPGEDEATWRDILEDEVLRMKGIVFYERDTHYTEQEKNSAMDRIQSKKECPQNGVTSNEEQQQEESDCGDECHSHSTVSSFHNKRRRIDPQDLDWPSWRVTRTNPTDSSHLMSSHFMRERPCVMQYALHVKDTKGKFLPKEAIKMGLKPGPLFGQLSKGNSVTLDDGTVIQPEQVHSPSQKGAVILVIYATDNFCDELLNRQLDFKEYQGDGAHPAQYVFHMVPPSLWHNQQYQQFVDGFQKDCQHVVSNNETLYSRDIFEGSSFLQEKLSHIDQQIFCSTRTTIVPDESLNTAKKSVWTKNKIPAQHGLQVVVHPRDKCRVDRSEVKAPQKFNITMDDELKGHIAEYKRAVEACVWDRNNVHEALLEQMSDTDAEIAFLGTGSAIPSKYRNVTGIFLNLFDAGNMFLDCGEGSYEQLCRVYGRPEVEDLLVKLQMVHISHMHADHHMGLLEVLERRAQIIKKRGIAVQPVMIIGPGMLAKFLQGVEMAAQETNFNYEFFSCNNLMPHEGRSEIPPRLEQVLEQLGLTEFYNIKVDHSCLAYGVIMKHKMGWKLVFSGDTRPCASLVDHGKDATILIHEATHDDELHHEAVARKHSTTNEAISIGEEMRAYRTILTHFSQRYPKFPKLHETVADHVGIAFDLCKLNFKSLKTFPKALPAMQNLFEETIMLDEDAEELPDTDHL